MGFSVKSRDDQWWQYAMDLFNSYVVHDYSIIQFNHSIRLLKEQY